MILTIDAGNTTITGGLFDGEKLLSQFRKSTNAQLSSDEIGIFLRDVITLNGFDHKSITDIACCSVVPAINHALGSAFVKYFGINALFLRSDVKTGLSLRYKNSKEIGADRLAAAMGAIAIKKNIPLIVVDMGTATTVDVITRNAEYLGGAILPGVRTSVRSLASGTAQLPSVELVKPENPCGSTTIEAIQSGIYYGQAGAIKELCGHMQKTVFSGTKPYIIGTGGFSNLFADYGLFDEVQSDLVLKGLLEALKLNR